LSVEATIGESPVRLQAKLTRNRSLDYCLSAGMRIHYAHVAEAIMRKIALNAIRQPANLSIDSNLMREAKGLDVNVSRAAEAGIAEAVAAEKTRLWKLENRATMDAWNDYVEKNGIPLEEYRQF
jgi:antitoxin CcdA